MVNNKKVIRSIAAKTVMANPGKSLVVVLSIAFVCFAFFYSHFFFLKFPLNIVTHEMTLKLLFCINLFLCKWNPMISTILITDAVLSVE